jgi:hypothetical protein
MFNGTDHFYDVRITVLPAVAIHARQLISGVQ